MGSYLQTYGVDEARRSRIIKWLVLSFISIALLSLCSYLFFHNFFEKRVVARFLDQVNASRYQQAYVLWGCTDATPCPNYTYKSFLEDWGAAKKIKSPWKIDSVDGCTGFVTVNVAAAGVDIQSLAVERGGKTISYAPAAECQERRWHWKEFFQRLTGRS